MIHDGSHSNMTFLITLHTEWIREYGNELKYTSATDFLRFDGECWREDKQMAIGAVEEFLDLQLQDAMDEVARVEKALEDAGVPKESIQAGPKELLKEVDGKLIPLVYMLMGAQTYLKFVQKRRDYKYIVSAANTAKPMIAISVSDLDKNENLINTPYATYDLRKGLAGDLPHNPEDLITKITACSPGEDGKQIWLDALNLFFCKDQKLIDYVQETVGMAAIGKVYQEHMIIASSIFVLISYLSLTNSLFSDEAVPISFSISSIAESNSSILPSASVSPTASLASSSAFL